MSSVRADFALVLMLAASACGGHSRQESEGTAKTPELQESVLARGVALRFEAISGDGALVAYSAENAGGGREVWVTGTTEAEPELLGVVGDLDSARFDGPTLLVFRGDGVADGQGGSGGPCSGKACGLPPESWAPELLAWSPGRAGLTSLALDVDPGSVRFARDGRWISLEANDLPRSGTETPELLLVDTEDFSVRRLGAFNLARARFTRDSDWLVFGGETFYALSADIADHAPAACEGHFVARLSLRDGSVLPVACYDAPLRSRWEVTRDGEWLVHALAREGDNTLARTPLAGGEPEVLFSGLGGAESGKSFDVGGGDPPQVAFIRGDIGDSTRALAIIPFATGASETVLASECVQAIADYHGATITYRCGDLFAVPASGGASTSLGEMSRITDELFTDLLALDQYGELRRFRGSNHRVDSLSVDVHDARFLGDTSTLASVGSGEPPWALMFFDDSDVSRSLGDVTGPFGVDPATRTFFVTTRELDGESSLVIGSLVSP